MFSEEDLAFPKAQLAELFSTDPNQLKWDIVAEKRRRQAEAPAKAKGSGKRPLASPLGPKPALAGRRFVSQKIPRATGGQGQRFGLVRLRLLDATSKQVPGVRADVRRQVGAFA
jgi:hypothetical protein